MWFRNFSLNSVLMVNIMNQNNNSLLNKSILSCINSIIKIGASSKGDQFDETVKDKLRLYLKGAKYISSEQWCSKDKNSIFKEHYKKTLKNCFDFTDLPTIIDNGVPIKLMIIDKPNGSQKWPDIMIVNNGIGFPIEIKSSKTDSILWNSGLPKANSLYIYNCYGKSKTTCFLGQHAISKEEVDFLQEMSQKAKELNKKFPNGNWSYYVRDMFNSNQIFFEDEIIMERNEQELIKIESLKQKLIKTIENNKYSALKIEGERLKIAKRQSKNYELLTKYHQIKSRRLKIEQETLEFIDNLSWDKNQQTVFDMNKLT